MDSNILSMESDNLARYLENQVTAKDIPREYLSRGVRMSEDTEAMASKDM